MKNNKQVLLTSGEQQINLAHCTDVLSENSIACSTIENRGNLLLQQFHTQKVDEALLTKATDYMQSCKTMRKTMMEKRMVYTRLLTSIQKQFVYFENCINPDIKTSLPAQVKQQMQQSLIEKRAGQEADLRRLERNYSASIRRIEKRNLSDDENRDKLKEQAAFRLSKGRIELQNQIVPVQLVPVVTSPDGYLDLFKFYWEEQGKMLTEKEMQRLFHPMMMFAKKQAAKGVLIKSAGINYQEIPIV